MWWENTYDAICELTMTQVCSMKNVDIELQSLFIFFFRLTIDRLENEKKEIQHELHIYKQQSSGTQVNIGGECPTMIVLSNSR